MAVGGSIYSSKIGCDLGSNPKPISKDTTRFDQLTTNGFQLLGSGIRRVTLLQFDAYNLYLYIQSKDIARIKQNKRWVQEYNSSKLSSSDKEFYINDLVNSDLALEIKPTRVTGGGHLVNGIARFLNQKYKEHELNPNDAKEFKNALNELKCSFPKLQIVKGASILFKKCENTLQVYLNGHEIAQIKNQHLSRWFFEAYLGQISPSFVADVGLGLENIFH